MHGEAGVQKWGGLINCDPDARVSLTIRPSSIAVPARDAGEYVPHRIGLPVGGDVLGVVFAGLDFAIRRGFSTRFEPVLAFLWASCQVR